MKTVFYYFGIRRQLKFHPFRKAVAVFAGIILGSALLQAQDVTGQWNGVLSVPGMNLRVVFNIEKSGEGYKSTMDSPDQGVKGIAITTTTFDGSKLSLAIPANGILYEGAFQTDSIAGTFKQAGQSFPLTLKRSSEKVKPIARPQEPKPPFPYISEDVAFANKTAGITLAGTLTMPSTGSNFTAVILITGSGAQDRNEEVFGHKPFLVIADYLTRRGIAVLRYDDRGTAQSTGDFHTATSADFATDAESAIAWLKTRREINPNKIGLMGHSEGGVIAPMVAARSNDVAFIVMLAGTGIRGDKLLLLQEELIYRVAGIPEEKLKEAVKINSKVFDRIVNTNDAVSQQDITGFMASMKDDIAKVIPEGVTADDYIRQLAASLSSPWMQYFLRYDPAPALEKVKCPVWAVNGSKDLQVPAKENLTAIRKALEKGGNRQVTVKEYPGLNHLFQESATGSPTEYGVIEQTFSPEVLKDLSEWLQGR